MAKRKVIWSLQAIEQRIQILSCWIEHNSSKDYSLKLNSLFSKAIELIAAYPKIGKLTDDKLAQIKIVRNYWIVYDYYEDTIFVLAIFDSKQEPIKLKY